MSFYIEFYHEKTGYHTKITWNIPTEKPKGVDLEQKIMLQADGDELNHIYTRFIGMPQCYRICKWRGEMAAFIFENL